MKINFLMIATVCAILLAGISCPAGATQVGGDQGWYIVHCNEDGASVSFDGEYKGEISGGQLSVAVYTTGTPYRELTVSKDGYNTFTETITQYPAKGETVDLYATLNPVGTPVGPIGGDQGWYIVHCNVDGASVFFDGESKGVISGGQLSVAVYTTGTPYRELTVSKDGYNTFTEAITQYPAKGETVDLYATLNQVSPSPTPTPLPPFLTVGALLIIGCVAATRAGRR